MLTLSKELRDALRQSGSQPLRVSDPETQAQYVVIPADLFDRLSGGEWGGPLSRDEQLRVLAAAGERAGWNDPEMDVYNDLLPAFSESFQAKS